MAQLLRSDSLEQGIQTARGGHRLLARLHLEKAAHDDPQNPEVWLWLAWVADSPAEAAKHLREALTVSPDSPQAQAGLVWIESLSDQLASTAVSDADILTDLDVSQDLTDDPENSSTAEIEIAPSVLQTWESEVIGDDTGETYEWSVDEILDSSQADWRVLDDSEVGEILEIEAEPVYLEVLEDEPSEVLEVAEVCDEEEVCNEETADTHDSVQDEPPEDPTPPRVLLLDASPTFRKLATLALTRSGYEVEATDNEIHALDHLVAVVPDVILIDSTTPSVGGYQFCKQIKKHAETKHIPVLLLSGEDTLFDRMRGRLSGCAGSVAKPVSWENLVAKVERHVARVVAS